MISNQKFKAENQVTRPCVAILVIFNSFPCSGITGGIHLEGGALLFNLTLYIVALKEALRTVIVFTVAVRVAKTAQMAEWYRASVS